MENKIKSIYSYWSMVFREAFKLLEGDMRGLAIGVISSFILACISTAAYFFNITSTEWVDQTWQEAFLGLASACVSGGLLILGLFFVVAYIPSKLHDSQASTILDKNTKIGNLEEELRKDPVDVELDIYEYTIPERGYSKMACVVVKNLGKEDVRCYGALTLLKRLNTDRTTDNLLSNATQNGSMISWRGVGLNDDMEMLVKAGHDGILNIAEGAGRILVFKLQGYEFHQNQNGTYIFDIEIGGHIGNKKISNKKACFQIEYENLHKTFAGGEEKPYGTTDFVNQTSIIEGYQQYDTASFRKLEIKKRNCEHE